MCITFRIAVYWHLLYALVGLSVGLHRRLKTLRLGNIKKKVITITVATVFEQLYKSHKKLFSSSRTLN